MRRFRLALLVAIAACAPTWAAAGPTAVQFEDGRFLEIRDYEIVQQWIRLRLSSDGYLLVPLRGVDMIERDGRRVYERPALSAAGRSDRGVAVAASPSRRARS